LLIFRFSNPLRNREPLLRGLSRARNLVAFMRGMPSNLRVMVVRSSITSFVNNMNPYGSLYVFALGATGTQLGLLNSAGLALSSAFALLTGWISDRGDRKRIYLAGALLGLLVPLIFGGSWTWAMLLPAFLLSGISDGVVQPSWAAMYANSIKSRQRGTIYGLVNVFVLAPILVAGLVGGAIVSYSGGLTALGIRPIYWLQFGLLVGTWIFVSKLLEGGRWPVGRDAPLSPRTIVDDYREVLGRSGVRSWVLMKSLGSISIGMAGPFWMVYAAVVHGASAMTIAYMVTVRSATQILFSPLSGRLVDSIGRKKMIISGRMIMYAASAIFLVGGNDLILVLAWVLMGVNDATGIAWSAEEVELVNPDQRSRITAMSHGAFNALAVPASILGGFLWDNVSPLAPFIVMILIDGCLRMPIIHFFVPESDWHAAEAGADPDQSFSMDF
jgi:MFS family permease